MPWFHLFIHFPRWWCGTSQLLPGAVLLNSCPFPTLHGHRPAMHISIKSTEERTEQGKTFTVYAITIGDAAFPSSTRRYSEFREFHVLMSTENAKLNFPPFPPKKWFGAMDASFVLARSAGLEEYLRALVGVFRNRPQEEDALRVFCGGESRY